ncbi:MAG: ABC transporter substrate-binding protein [Candidatus Limnocylindria bacterium]
MPLDVDALHPSTPRAGGAADHPIARLSRPAGLGRGARRIVSLLPSATEIVAALGLTERLVGITHECDYPPDIGHLPRLTADLTTPASSSREIDAAVREALSDGHGLYRLDAPELAALRPDLVLTQELCSVCAIAYPAVMEAARMAGGRGDEPLVVSLEPHRLEDVLASIELVARLCNAEVAGRELLGRLRHRLSTVQRTTVTRRAALVEWLDPLFAPGHWVPDQLTAAGGQSVFGTAGARSVESSWEALAEADPDVVILGLCGFDLARTRAEWASFNPPTALRSTRAWAEGEVWALDGSAYVSRPGPRLVDGVEIMADILRGPADDRAFRLPST